MRSGALRGKRLLKMMAAGRIFFTTIVLVQLLHTSNSGRRCGHGFEYGVECSFLPAPPGRTPACAAPGYTYCEQLDHYPNDLIRHLVDKGEYDFSTLLSDETRDDFASKRPSQGPYGYGPHSLSGISGISLVTEKPTYKPQQQPQGQEQHGQQQFHFNVPYSNNGGGYQGGGGGYQNGGGGNYQNTQQYFPPNKGNVVPTNNNGYNRGQYDRRRPQPYLPSRDSYLPAANASKDFFRDTYDDDFWPSFRQRSPFEYYDNNGPYYSARRDEDYKAVPAGQAGWTGKRGQFAFSDFVPPPVTPYNPSDWWKRNSNHHRRSSAPSHSSYKSLDSNELNIRSVNKRDVDGNKQKRHPFLESIRHHREKRQAQPGTGGEQLCPTRAQYITPRAALNKQGNWMYVVNMESDTDSNYSQLVKSEICVSQQCDGLCSLPLGYTSRCEQRYVQKRLVALDQGGSRLYTDVFWFPSCCLCTISNNNNQT